MTTAEMETWAVRYRLRRAEERLDAEYRAEQQRRFVDKIKRMSTAERNDFLSGLRGKNGAECACLSV